MIKLVGRRLKAGLGTDSPWDPLIGELLVQPVLEILRKLSGGNMRAGVGDTLRPWQHAKCRDLSRRASHPQGYRSRFPVICTLESALWAAPLAGDTGHLGHRSEHTRAMKILRCTG